MREAPYMGWPDVPKVAARTAATRDPLRLSSIGIVGALRSSPALRLSSGGRS
jgi:hypothetical protein